MNTLPIVYCALVIGLFVSYITTFLCHGKVSRLVSSLPSDVVPTYRTIRAYRIAYFMMGIVVAVIVTGFYHFHSEYEYKGWVSAILFLLIPMVVYMIIPKSWYLLFESVNCKPWFDVYLCMKNAMIYGFLITFLCILVFGLIVNALVTKNM